MSKIPGFLMILAGVGAAAYVIPTMETADHRAEKQQVADVVSISTTGKTPAADVAKSEVPSAPTETAKPAHLPAISAPLIALLPSSSSLPPPAKPMVVPSNDNGSTGPARRDGVVVRAPDKSRLALTRDIQKELKRVGCYAGEADGEWNAATQQSMKTFIDRVNATLPINEPDHILKTLVQGHPGDACGKSCPAGQGLSTDGRCLPSAILAQTPKRIVQAPQRREPVPRPTTTTASVPVPVTPIAPAAEAPRPKIVSSWESTVTLATPSAPPPGRMSIGAGTKVTAALPSIVTPRAPTTDSTMPPAPVAPRTTETASKPAIVIKPRAGTVTAKAGDKPMIGDLGNKEFAPPAPTAQPPKIAAVTAFEPLADEPPPTRETQQRRPSPPVAAYRPPPPPPRYVGVYSAPSRPVYTQRNSFGPEIFRRLDMNGR